MRSSSTPTSAVARRRAWVLTGVDPEGCDLRQGAETARLWFDEPVRDADGPRAELVRADQARAQPAPERLSFGAIGGK